MGRLEITVVEAKNLPDIQTFGMIDPYVIVRLDGRTYKGKYKDNTQNPVWNDVYHFNVTDDESEQLHVEVWNANTAADDFLGCCIVSIAGLTRGVTRDDWHILNQCKANAEIRVQLKAADFGKETPPPVSAPLDAPHPEPPAQADAKPDEKKGDKQDDKKTDSALGYPSTGDGGLGLPPQGADGMAQAPGDAVAPPAKTDGDAAPPQAPPTDIQAAVPNLSPLQHGTVYEIEPRHAPGMRIDVAGAHKTDGTTIHLWESTNHGGQRFVCHVLEPNKVMLSPLCAVGSYIDVGGEKHATRLKSHPTPHDDATFILHPTEKGYLRVESASTGRVWDCAGGKSEKHTKLLTWTNNKPAPGEAPHREFLFLAIA